MIIDVSNADCGHELDDMSIYTLKSGHIYQNIKKINHKKFNYLIVSVDVANVLENHIDFKKSPVDSKEEGIYYMGELMELKVYVDLYLSPNSIMLRFDKQTKRDLRIDSILNGDSIDESMKVMVKY